MKTSMRTHLCGELRLENSGNKVSLVGWIDRIRDHGGMIFINLRDRSGIVQVVFEDEYPELQEEVKKWHREYVVKIEGVVRERPDDMKNKKMETGDIEIVVNKAEVLSPSLPPPFNLDEIEKTQEDLRLKYRYIDLRRPYMQEALKVRSQIMDIVREYLKGNGFWEVETPILTKSTPEGSRDYLVPSRIHIGKFYCLAQSPQLYKQILMVSGVDRYFQFARAFRDEDMRSDRQPEHTQIDMEMSFVSQEDVFRIVEGMMFRIFKEIKGIELNIPFPIISYEEAMSRFGSDKPDMRFGLELKDITDWAHSTTSSLMKGWKKAVGIGGNFTFSRKDIDNFEKRIKEMGGKGLGWIKIDKDKVSGPLSKFTDEKGIDYLKKTFGIEESGIVLFAGGDGKRENVYMGSLRLDVAKKLDMIPEDKYEFVWVTDFPLFEWNEEENRWEACHHIFTMPKYEDMEYIEKDPAKVRGQLYDLVVNGVELASGSIRIHRSDIQERVMKVIGMSEKEAWERFGFLLEAFKYGAPPHGGIAPGLDRLVMILLGRDNIRDVIAFPKTLTAAGLMEGCPDIVPEERLKELHIRIVEEE